MGVDWGALEALWGSTGVLWGGLEALWGSTGVLWGPCGSSRGHRAVAGSQK